MCNNKNSKVSIPNVVTDLKLKGNEMSASVSDKQSHLKKRR
jgi:hypothetical protein